MDTLQFTHDTVRWMGVHVLAVYMLLRCAEEEGIVPVMHQWILDHMPDKTSPNTVTAALRWLTSPERQIALRVTGGWRLNQESVFQLPLSFALEENLSQSENRAERESEPLIIINSSSINIDSINNNNKDENRALRDSRKQELEISADFRSEAELEDLTRALSEHKIIGKKKNELLACQWVNAEYVRAVVDYEKGERQPEYAIGRAINTMLDHVTQPVRRANGHMENCKCMACDVDKFFGGRYGDQEIDEDDLLEEETE